MMRVLKMNASEWHYITFGCIMALAQGAVQPAFALIFGVMLGVRCFCCHFWLMHVKLPMHEVVSILLCLNILILACFSGKIQHSSLTICAGCR